MTPSPSSSLSESLDLYPDSPHTHPVHSAYSQLSPQDYRPRASSNASSCGRLSPIPAIESDMHDSQVRRGRGRAVGKGLCGILFFYSSLINDCGYIFIHKHIVRRSLSFNVLKLPDAVQGTAHVPWHRRVGRRILAPPRPPSPARPRPVCRPVSGLHGRGAEARAGLLGRPSTPAQPPRLYEDVPAVAARPAHLAPERLRHPPPPQPPPAGKAALSPESQPLLASSLPRPSLRAQVSEACEGFGDLIGILF